MRMRFTGPALSVRNGNGNRNGPAPRSAAALFPSSRRDARESLRHLAFVSARRRLLARRLCRGIRDIELPSLRNSRVGRNDRRCGGADKCRKRDGSSDARSSETRRSRLFLVLSLSFSSSVKKDARSTRMIRRRVCHRNWDFLSVRSPCPVRRY